MEIKQISIDLIKPYEKNAKEHPKSQIDKIKNSIKEFGFNVPLILDKDNNIITGHGRYIAAKELGMTELPCIKKSDLTTAQIKAFRIADNKVAESDWMDDFLKSELSDLQLANYDLSFTGFDTDEINKLFPENKAIEEDDFVHVGAYERAKNNCKVQKGDIYSLGKHRLMCGNSTLKNDIKLLADGKEYDLVVTDPPYNVDYSNKNAFLNNLDMGQRSEVPIQNDNTENFKEFCISFLNPIPMAEYNSIYCFIGGKEIHNLILSFAEAGYYYSQDLKWVKNNHVLGRLDYNPKSENIIYGWKGRHKFYGGFNTDVLEFNKPVKSEEHPTMKPIELLSRLIMNGSQEGQIVYDAFGGSGSTLIACEQLNRKCYMMEIDPVYCQIIINRWEKFTGLKAQKIN